MQDPPLSQEILDHARECAREYPEGMFSAGAMGVTDEDIARLDPARLVSEETRRQALREAFDFVSSGLTYEEFIYERNLASYYSDHEVSEHGDVPDGDSASNPIVIDDDELLNDAYAADDGEVSLAAELDGGDRATHQSNASDDGNFYDFDDGDDVERFEHVSVDASSDSDSSDDSLISEYDQIPDDEAASESGASDDDALEVYETQSDHGDDAEDFSPPHAPEQTVSNDAEMSADSEEYDSDYAQSRPSRVAKARSKSKAIKTAPRTDRVTSKPSNAQSKKTQAPKKKAHRLSSQLSGGGKLQFVSCHREYTKWSQIISPVPLVFWRRRLRRPNPQGSGVEVPVHQQVQAMAIIPMIIARTSLIQCHWQRRPGSRETRPVSMLRPDPQPETLRRMSQLNRSRVLQRTT